MHFSPSSGVLIDISSNNNIVFASLSVFVSFSQEMLLHLSLALRQTHCLSFSCCWIVFVISCFSSHFPYSASQLPFLLSETFSSPVTPTSFYSLSIKHTVSLFLLFLERARGGVCSSIWPVGLQR